MKGLKAKSQKNTGSVSLIFFLLNNLTDVIYNSFKNGFFGKIFTSYSVLQDSFDNGFIKNIYAKSSKVKTYVRTIKKYLSKNIEKSFFVALLSKLNDSIVSLPLKSYGNLFFAFGLYTVIIYFLRLFLPIIPTADVSYVIVGAIICLSSLPMLLSRDNLAMAVGKSALLGTIFYKTLGFREESFRKRTEISRAKANTLTIVGISMGLLTLAIHPLNILLLFAALILIVLILWSPEIGIIISLFTLPFLSFFDNPSIILAFIVAIVFISYMIKVFRGKRLFRFGLIDYAVLLFSCVIFFSGTITAGGNPAFNEVLISCELLLGYFLTVNLIRTTKWVKRCIYSFLSSGTLVAVLGIAQYFFGIVSNNNWLDTEYFFDIKGRVTSVFDNPNVLAVYLVIVLPFSLYALTRAKTGKEKILLIFSMISVIGCIVLTWSRGAWIAATICILMFLLIFNKKILRYLCIFGIFLPFVPFFLPQSIVRRITSIGDMSDSSTMYRVYTWRGTVNGIIDHLISGIGYGNSAFRQIYPQYAYAGIEAAEHSHNLFLQLTFGLGIFGLLVFIVVIFLFLQMNFELISTTNDQRSRTVSITCISAIVSCLAFGMVDFIWYDYRIFFLFWVVIALSCACFRIGQDESRKQTIKQDIY